MTEALHFAKLDSPFEFADEHPDISILVHNTDDETEARRKLHEWLQELKGGDE